MGSINVNRNVTDLFYRYKMPRISAKVEGKGNGIKTVVVNMTDIAKALGRPPTYPTKYFGCELGAQTLVDAKNDRYIVNGSHDSIKLQDLLDGFIKKYVLCPECDNPETVLTVKKSAINQSCKACGFHGALKSIHKLNTYIIKNPPSSGAAANNTPADAANGAAAGGKKSKRVSKKSNGGVETQQTAVGGLTNGTKVSKDRSNSPDEDKLNDSMAAVQLQEKISENGEHFQNGKAENNCSDDGDDDGAEWAVDLSEDAVRARRSDLTDGAQKMTLTEELEKTEKERIDMFYEFVKERRDLNAIETDAQEKELLTRAEQLEIKSKSTLVLAELLFDQNIAVQTMKYRKLLLRFTRENRKAQKYLITGIEQIIGMYSDILLAKTAGIFQLFYKWDIISEEEFLEWDAKMTKKASKGGIGKEIHKLALPFINWLKEAEEESDDSDSDDKSSGSDIEVVYDDSRSRIDNSRKAFTSSGATKPSMTSSNSNNTNSDEANDDFDIDAI